MGGELAPQADLVREAVRHARQRLAADAHDLGANAVVGMRIILHPLEERVREAVVYGTAVTIRSLADAPN